MARKKNIDGLTGNGMEISPSPQSFEIKNLAEGMSKDKLDKIGRELTDGYKNDVESLSELNKMRIQWNKLFDLAYEEKTFPWPKASNIKIPMITTACFNFYARAFTNVLGRFPYLKVYPFGATPEDFARALRVEKHMNFQISFEMTEILDNYRKLYMALPKDGSAFSKVYYDPFEKRNVLEHILQEDIVVNYNCRDFYKSYRTTHVLYMNLNEIMKRGRTYDGQKAIFINTDDLGDPVQPDLPEIKVQQDKNNSETPPMADYTTPRQVLEIHTYLDLNDSGIREPYIAFVDLITSRVFRIISRKNPRDPKKLMEYFTLYTFFPNPSSIYGYGFGRLLLAINHVANTNINQMTDSATLANMQTGVVSAKSGIKRGTFKLQMGEFTEVDTRVDDLSKAIFPLKFEPPSPVLMSLVTFLQGYVDRITTVTELFTGGTPRSDTSATATQSAVQLGMVTFTNIQAGCVESFGRDCKKMYINNSLYLDKEKEQYTVPGKATGDNVLNFISIADYALDARVLPTADPKIISNQQLIQKAEYMFNAVMQNPILAQNPEAIAMVFKNRLEAMELPQYEIDTLVGLMNRVAGEQQAQQQALAQQQAAESQAMQQAHSAGYATGAAHATKGHEVMQKIEQSKKVPTRTA